MRHHRRILALLVVQRILVEIVVALTIFVEVIQYIKTKRRSECRVLRRRYHLNSRLPDQVRNMHRLVSVTDDLQMDRNVFDHLCCLLEQSGGIKTTKNVSVAEQVVMFLSIISHHKKNCVVKHDFIRFGRTVSKHKHFHSLCLLSVRCIQLSWLSQLQLPMNAKTIAGSGLRAV
ncbi:UNVERIFIED_CONTAM: hypothetical protein Slati_2892400 [Sesamum latifolium]|uniref:DUF8040 domain-containing protein n=1 Tax=Sesamum latifolium TaxID=2727402 RepID=A0AAW2VD34_9LAMI